MSKPSFEETLENEVISKGKCLGCAACVVACPFGVLDYVEGKPRLIDECKNCGICSRVCQVLGFAEAEIEEKIFGRRRREDEDFGVYREMFIARAVDKAILASCQDGGVVTALLSAAFKRGIIDGAAVSGLDEDKPFYPVPQLISKVEEAIKAAGTRYTYSPNLIAFKKGVDEKREGLAFVGTPCQIRALRKIEEAKLKKYVKPLKFSIGLFCSECFNYEELFEKYLKEEVGLNPSEITKMNIKGKMIIDSKSGKVEIPLKKLRVYARPECRLCPDFSAEFADISVGGVGLEGWTLTIVRSARGEEIFKSALDSGFIEAKPVEKESKAIDLLVKLTKIKRRRFSKEQ